MVDYIIDIGYEGGRGGGMIVAEGTPEEVAKDNKSYTAKFLKKELESVDSKRLKVVSSQKNNFC